MHSALRFVMAGLVPAIHAFCCGVFKKTWMPGTRPGMTTVGLFRNPDRTYAQLPPAADARTVIFPP